MTEIHIVHGSSGEYSDRSEWPIAAFASDASAKAEVTRLDTIRDTFSSLCLPGGKTGTVPTPSTPEAIAAYEAFRGKWSGSDYIAYDEMPHYWVSKPIPFHP